MPLTVGELNALLRLDDRGFHRGMQDAESAFMSLASTAAKWTAAAAASILALAGASTKLAIDFEDAFAGVRKTVDASEPELARLRQGIRDMAKEIPASTTEIAEVAEAAGQLGIQTRHILGFTRTMVNLGVATNLSGQQAATALARLANITQMSQDEFDRLGSTIVELGNNLATTEAEIVEMGLRIAGAGHQIGLTEAQILALAGALSSVGIEAQAGGSAISRVMIEVANQVASSGENLAMFAEVAGMTATEFQRAFREDAAGAIVTFVEGLARMSTEGENVFAVLDELGLAEIRVRDALLRAAGAGELMRQSLELATTAWEENTALVQEAEQRYDTSASKLTLLKNNLSDVGITIGDAVLPAFRGVLDRAIPALERLQGWVEAHAPEIQAAIAGALEAIGQAAQVAVEALGEVREWLGALLDLMRSGDWQGAGRMIGEALASGLEQIADFGARLSRGIVDSIRAIDWSEVARAAIPAVVGFIVGFVNGLLDPAVWWDIVSQNWQEILLLLLSIITLPERWIMGLARFLGRIPLVGKILEWLLTSIRSVGEKALEPFMQLGRRLIEGFTGGLGVGGLGILPRLRALLDDAVTALYVYADDFWKAALRFMENLGRGIAERGPRQVVDGLRYLIARMDEVLGGAVTRFGEIGRRIIEGFWKGLSSMFDWIRTRVSEFVGSMVSKVKGVLGISSPSRVFAGIGENIAQGLALGLESARGVVERATAGALVAPTLRLPAAPVMAGAGAPGGGYRTANIVIELDGRAVANIVGQHLVDELRLRTPIR